MQHCMIEVADSHSVTEEGNGHGLMKIYMNTNCMIDEQLVKFVLSECRTCYNRVEG